MRVLINNLWWWIHRVLCYVGAHAIDKVYMFDDGSDEFQHDGWFCPVCNKTWEEK